MSNRPPDDLPARMVADLLGLPMHRLFELHRAGLVDRPMKRRARLIAVARAHVVALKADAARRHVTRAQDASGCRAADLAVAMAREALLALLAAERRAARLPDPETRRAAVAAIGDARARLISGRAEALRRIARHG